MTERTLNMKIRQLEKLEAEKQLLEKQIEAIKTSIQSTMGDSEELSTKRGIKCITEKQQALMIAEQLTLKHL